MVVRELVTSLGFKVDEKNLNSYSKNLGGLKAGLLAAGAAAIGAGWYFLKAAGEMEQSQIALETMLGSAETAKKLLKDLSVMAAKTPFEKTELIEYTKRLTAFGFGVEEIIPTMTDLGNIAAGVGKDKLGTLVLALGKIKTKGKASLEELNMFIEAGAINMEEWAKSIGTTTPLLYDQISKGKIGYNEVREEIERLNKTRFKGLMEKQSHSFLGIISNVMDMLNEFAIKVGDRLIPIVEDFIDEFTYLFGDGEGLVELIGFIAEVFADAFAYAFVIIEDLFFMIKDVVDYVVDFFGGWDKILPILKKIMPLVILIGAVLGAAFTAWVVLIPFLIYIIIRFFKIAIDGWKRFGRGVSDTFSAIKNFFTGIISVIGNFVNAITNAIADFGTGTYDFFVGIGQAIYDWWIGLIDWVTSSVNNLVSMIGDKLGKAGQGVKGFFGFGADSSSDVSGSSKSYGAMADSVRSSNTSSTIYNTNPTINLQVPEGNTRQQNQAIKSQAERAARQVFQSELKKLTENNPSVEASGKPAFIGLS